jgi:hypothetical protein
MAAASDLSPRGRGVRKLVDVSNKHDVSSRRLSVCVTTASCVAVMQPACTVSSCGVALTLTVVAAPVVCTASARLSQSTRCWQSLQQRNWAEISPPLNDVKISGHVPYLHAAHLFPHCGERQSEEGDDLPGVPMSWRPSAICICHSHSHGGSVVERAVLSVDTSGSSSCHGTSQGRRTSLTTRSARGVP